MEWTHQKEGKEEDTWIGEIQTILREREIEDLQMDKQVRSFSWKLLTYVKETKLITTKNFGNGLATDG